MKTQNGTSRLSRWVWAIGLILLIVGALQTAWYWISNPLFFQCAGIGIGLWYYISHTSTSHQQPTAVGGSANETGGTSSSTAGHGSSSSPFVTPTFTLARRDGVLEPTPTAFIRMPSEDAVKANTSRHNRKLRLRNF